QDLMLGFVEQPVPKNNLGILDQHPPELDEVAVAWPLSGQRGLDELVELAVAFASAFEVDAAFAGGPLVMFTEAGDARGRNALGVAGAERVEERTVALVEEEDAVNVVGFAEIGRQAGPKRAHVRVEKAEGAGLSSLQVHFGDLLHSWNVRAKHVLNRTEQFHPA